MQTEYFHLVVSANFTSLAKEILNGKISQA